jgi:hypothetical protein
MKKIFLILTVLAVANVQVKAQDSSKHELGLSAGTGLSTLLYKRTGDEGAVKGGAGLAGSLDYSYSFHPNIAIVTGLSLTYSSAQAESKAISQSVEQTYMFDVPTTLELASNLENFTERQKTIFLHIPIMVRYQSTIVGKTQYYVALGGKIGFNVWNKYKAHADALVTTGNFDEFKQIFKDVPSHNFLTTNNVNYSGVKTFNTPDFSIALEAGVKQTITRGTRLYVGLFCEYGLTNLLSIRGTEDALISYNPDNSRTFQYSGLFQSSHISSVHLLSAGLKVRFTFCLGR